MSCLKEGEVIRCSFYRIVYHTDSEGRPARYVNDSPSIHTDEQAVEWAQRWVSEHPELKKTQHKVYVERVIAMVGVGRT